MSTCPKSLGGMRNQPLGWRGAGYELRSRHAWHSRCSVWSASRVCVGDRPSAVTRSSRKPYFKFKRSSLALYLMCVVYVTLFLSLHHSLFDDRRFRITKRNSWHWRVHIRDGQYIRIKHRHIPISIFYSVSRWWLLRSTVTTQFTERFYLLIWYEILWLPSERSLNF